MKGAYPEIDSKQMISLPMPMIKDREELKRVHDEGAKIIAEWLEKGKNVVFLTLGDPTVYSTYIYVHKRWSSWDMPQKSSAALHPFVQSVPDLMKDWWKNPSSFM
ncbi:MAG: SAM-dependent methyltransferase [Ruminococcus sp.]